MGSKGKSIDRKMVRLTFATSIWVEGRGEKADDWYVVMVTRWKFGRCMHVYVATRVFIVVTRKGFCLVFVCPVAGRVYPLPPKTSVNKPLDHVTSSKRKPLVLRGKSLQ